MTDRPIADDDRLESPLREAVEAACSNAIPEDALQRVIAQAATIEHDEPPVVEPERRFGRGRRIMIAIAAAAAVMLAAIVWPTSESGLLAGVAEAVAAQPWMHVRGTVANGDDVEMWYSRPFRILAMRQGPLTTFINFKRGSMDVFMRKPGQPSVLSSVPIEPYQTELFERQEKFLLALCAGMPGRAFESGKNTEIEQTQKSVTVGDETLDLYQFTQDIDGQRMVTSLKVDPKSRLPVSWESKLDGKTVMTCRVDFPADGPRSIYALGVPADVERNDKTPASDQQQILDDWKRGRTEFDDYRAIVVESSSADHRAEGSSVYQVWHRGNRWRVERLQQPVKTSQNPNASAVPSDADPEAWWLTRGREWKGVPSSVSDGKREIKLQRVFAEPRRPDPDNPRYGLIDHLEARPTNAFDHGRGGDPQPDEREIMPQFQTYPFLFGQGNWSVKTEVHAKPKSGPRGHLLIESLKTDHVNSGRILGARYWTDRSMGNIVSQLQWLRQGADDDVSGELPKGVSVIEEMGSTPRGFWYPKVLRHMKNSMHLETRKVSDTVVRFYLDFDCEIPDALFDLTKWEAD